MKKVYIPILFIIAFVSFGACEKDDICIAGDTPKMRISFYDFENETLEKIPSQLLVVGKDKNTAITTASNGLLPLKPNASETIFYMVTEASIDSEGLVTGQIDTVIFTYNARPKFISKACGYIVNYENLIPVLSSNADNWIKKIEVITPTISNENDLHVKIYH